MVADSDLVCKARALLEKDLPRKEGLGKVIPRWTTVRAECITICVDLFIV
jgi:hypothetical protein